jgi:hypothetical protein
MRDEEGRDRDREDVVKAQRPAGEERHELVEGVPRERRRAARLRVVNGALGVRRRRRREDDAADDEDERGETERDAGGEAERVVDRRADVSVRGREEGVRPENAFELMGLPSPPGHLRTLR